jgi:hypothetical protein
MAMRIRVVDVKKDESGPTYVTFEAAAGTAAARWASRAQDPESGKEYHVELDIDVTADKNTKARDAHVDTRCLFMIGSNVVVRGTVEAVDEDGLAYLRLSPDCLVMLETAGDIGAGDVIQMDLPPSSVSITTIGI